MSQEKAGVQLDSYVLKGLERSYSTLSTLELSSITLSQDAIDGVTESYDLLSNFEILKCLKTSNLLFSISSMCVVQLNPELVKKAIFGRSELEEIYLLSNLSSFSSWLTF